MWVEKNKTKAQLEYLKVISTTSNAIVFSEYNRMTYLITIYKLQPDYTESGYKKEKWRHQQITTELNNRLKKIGFLP